jgi:A/G-specific adenine glycosylase
MAALPGGDWGDEPETGVNAIGTVRHVFTHFSLDLQIALGSEPSQDGWWHPVEGLGEAGLPSLYQRAAELVLAKEQRRAA